MKHCLEYSITSVFPSSFNKGITAGGELPQEVLVAVWGAEKAECQRATDNDTETEHRSQCASSDWTRSANSDRDRDGANTGALEILIEDRGRRKEGRHYREKKKVEAERKQRSAYVPYLGNIRNLNSSAGCVLCAISQATEDRSGECSMPKGASVHRWGINSRSIAMSGIRMKE